MINKTLFYIISTIFLITFIALFFTIKSNIDLRHDIKSIKNDTVIVEVTDTIFDTLYIKKPVPINTTIIKYDTMPCDSNITKIPIEQKHYHNDSVYDIWISGFEATLDSAKIYQKIITNTIYSEIKIPVLYKRKGIWFRLEGEDNYFGIGSIKR